MSSIQEKAILCSLSATSIIGGSIGYQMQINDSFREGVFDALNYDWAAFLQNQGTDLFLVPAIMFSFAFVCAEFGEGGRKFEPLYGVAIALAGAVGSALLILDELREMAPRF